MGGEHEDFCNLHVLRSVGDVESHVGYVGAGEGVYSFVDIIGTFVVAMEADVAEACLHESGFDVAYADVGGRKVDSQTIGECLDGGFVAQYTLPLA